MKKNNQGIAPLIREYLANNPELVKNSTNREIAERIIKDVDGIADKYKNNISKLAKYIWDVKKRSNDVVVDVGGQPKEIKTRYEVIGNKHHFYPIKGKFTLPNDLINDIFYSYSQHGLNLSTTQIINKFNLEPWQWHALKNALKLYKASNIFSPHTVESTDPEIMKDLVREKLDERVNTLGYIVEDEYNKSIIKKYKDVIRKSTRKELEVISLVNELNDLLPKVEIKPFGAPSNGNVGGGELILVISDIHFGLSNQDNVDLPEYSIEKAKECLVHIASQVNKLNADKVHVFNLGDVIETFQGNNHVGSWKGIEAGYYGSKLVIECYQLLTNFLLSIDNLGSYNQLPGNHDRSSSCNKEDVEGFISRIIFEFIQNSFKNEIEKGNISMNYNDILLSQKIGNINYLATHGHLGISKTPASELILEYADDPRSYTVLLQGHLHSRKVKRDHKMFRDIIVPAVMPGNHYSVTSGYSSNSGFLVIKESENKKPIVIDYSL